MCRCPNLGSVSLLVYPVDMVGKHGESTYPVVMSPSIQWTDGVTNGLGVMMKEHDRDLEMLERLVPGTSF